MTDFGRAAPVRGKPTITLAMPAEHACREQVVLSLSDVRRGGGRQPLPAEEALSFIVWYRDRLRVHFCWAPAPQ
jgi:hypothetical protein